ncbi:uncharacterized protein NEMAJ01_1052 [Nematocida major]|uniref:uncharacterized protein n=1 Tax=Nematocida major TaxID=1912982 RepID=UPI0020089126|nr:uncharacterized protein NEMAJ01_1052 [Nematocida major]KAH9386156.1 hypothetical protein NEMAJ01_1052 [Nematocida major]
MKLHTTIRKTVIAAVQIVVAKCAMYEDFDYYGRGDGFNNGCGYAQPMQTLDDAYYYGDFETATPAEVGGCSLGGCGIGSGSVEPAINGGYSGEASFNFGACPSPAFAEQYAPQQYVPEQYVPQQYAPEQTFGYPAAGSYEMSTGYFNAAPVAQVASIVQESPVPVAHIASCARAQEASVEPITLLLNGNVPVDMHPTTITVGDQTFPLGGAPAISSAVANPLTIGSADVRSLDLSSAIIQPLPTPTQAEVDAAAATSAAGITAAQLKKEQEEKGKKGDKDGKKGKGKSGKKGSSAKKGAAANKKKNGVAGVSTLVAIAILPIVALIM